MADTTEKKPALPVRIVKGTAKWLREMRSELKKVVWPTRKQLTHNSILVTILILAVGTFVALLDWGIGSLVKSTISAITSAY